MCGEPSGYVGGVPVQELRAARIGDHVDDLGQVDHDEAPVVDQQVVGGHVAVRQPTAGERDQGRHELIPQPRELAAAQAGVGQPRRGGAVAFANELEQDFGTEHLHRVGHGDTRLMELAQGAELGVRPMPGDHLPPG